MKLVTISSQNLIKCLPALIFFGVNSIAKILPAWENIGSKVDIVIRDGKRCFTANGIPDHPNGKFPDRGNPNAILIGYMT
tara:strand:- start:382 stop:621 length:240 start_codon:yes stop_codon:yes gene_type:complete